MTLQRYPSDTLVEFSEKTLAAMGVSSKTALDVSTHLVEANLTGHDSHGIGLLTAYLDHIRGGQVDIAAHPRVIHETSVLLQMNGERAWGAPAGQGFVSCLIDKARENGLAAGTLGDVHHLGRIGAYADTVSDTGLISLHFVNVTDHAPLVAPFRGSDARFGTNPVCIGFPPTPHRPAFLLDMATSWIALGKARVAANAGKRVPFGAILDSQGRPTDDPRGMSGFELNGALAPLGRHKGYGLAFACEFLAGLLSRSGTIQPDKARQDGILNSMFSIVLDPAAFGDVGWMQTEMDAMAAYALASPPMDWDSPVLYPGDPERALKGKRLREGIPLDPATVDQLNTAARKATSPVRLETGPDGH